MRYTRYTIRYLIKNTKSDTIYHIMNNIISHPPLFLYIIGLGRSGSTVLNAYLSRYPEAVALGEIAGEMPRQELRPTEGRECTCGQTLGECPFWSSVPRTATDLEGWYNDVLNSPTLKQYNVVIDASKTIEGFRAGSKVAKALGYDVCAVYLMKEPGAWAYSMRRTDNAPLIIGDLLNFKRWAQQKRRFARALRESGIPYTTLSYKDFCVAPDRVSEAIMSECGLASFSNWKTAPSSTHITGGSRVRHDASRLNTISFDSNWKQDIFLRLTRPIKFFLGKHTSDKHITRSLEIRPNKQ